MSDRKVINDRELLPERLERLAIVLDAIMPRCAELVRDANALLKEQEAEIETEGGGSSWWHVCGECRGPVDTQDRYCRHCGSKLKQ